MVTWILCLHYIADYLFQTPEMGRQKSEKLKVLFKHCLIHFGVFAVGMLDLGIGVALMFALITAILHGIIDWFLWRGYKQSVLLRNPGIPLEVLKREWRYWEDPWFIKTIGFDQLLHGLCLVGLWNLFSLYLVA